MHSMLGTLEELGAYWFEEPVAPEDLEGYRELRQGLRMNISGGEAELTVGIGAGLRRVP